MSAALSSSLTRTTRQEDKPHHRLSQWNLHHIPEHRIGLVIVDVAVGLGFERGKSDTRVRGESGVSLVGLLLTSRLLSLRS